MYSRYLIEFHQFRLALVFVSQLQANPQSLGKDAFGTSTLPAVKCASAILGFITFTLWSQFPPLAAPLAYQVTYLFTQFFKLVRLNKVNPRILCATGFVPNNIDKVETNYSLVNPLVCYSLKN